MWTWLRRVFWLSLVCGAGYVMYTVWQRKHEPVVGGPPEWPPFDVASTLRDAAVDEPSASSTDRAWAERVDGRCPDGFPIKANDKSGIFHVPGGRFYERTIPDRCYPDDASAQADGYRRAKA